MSRAGWVAALALLACQRSEPAPRQRSAAVVEAAAARAPGPPLHVPAAGGPRVPLLVFLHGLGGSGQDLVQGLGVAERAEALGFAYLAPDGALDRAGRRFWNASASCCDFDRAGVDHVAALRGWIADAAAHPRVDAGRIWLIGFSNGGFLAHRAACELELPLAGIVSIAGAAASDPPACAPARPLTVVQIHGDRDDIVRFEGGVLFGDASRPRHPGAAESLARWAELNGCARELEAIGSLDLDPRLPGAETTIARHPACSGGRVELWRIARGDHFSGLGGRSFSEIWERVIAPSVPVAPPEPPR